MGKAKDTTGDARNNVLNTGKEGDGFGGGGADVMNVAPRKELKPGDDHIRYFMGDTEGLYLSHINATKPSPGMDVLNINAYREDFTPVFLASSEGSLDGFLTGYEGSVAAASNLIGKFLFPISGVSMAGNDPDAGVFALMNKKTGETYVIASDIEAIIYRKGISKEDKKREGPIPAGELRQEAIRRNVDSFAKNFITPLMERMERMKKENPRPQNEININVEANANAESKASATSTSESKATNSNHTPGPACFMLLCPTHLPFALANQAPGFWREKK